MAVGSDIARIHHLAQPLTGPDAFPKAMVAMALEARLCVRGLAACGQRAINRVWIRRRLQRPRPVANPLDAAVIDGDGRDAGAKASAEVALIDRVVVPVPMQLQPFARLLVPQRWQIRR